MIEKFEFPFYGTDCMLKIIEALPELSERDDSLRNQLDDLTLIAKKLGLSKVVNLFKILTEINS